MALINKIRQKSGWAIFIVTLALISFLVGGDLLSSNSKLFGTDDSSVGSIDGIKVAQLQLQEEIDFVTVQTRRQMQGKPLNPQQLLQVQSDAWSRMIMKLAYLPRFSELGIQVSKEERDDLLAGRNIHPSLRQSFTDPNTGQFSKESLVQFIQSVEGAIPNDIDEGRKQQFLQQREDWEQFKNNVPEGRVQQKYSNLLAKSSYVTKKEAERNYMGLNTQANIRYVYVPYYSVSDSTVEVTDAMLKSYLKENSKKFETEGTRAFDYAIFTISPSALDTAAVQEEMTAIVNDFKESKNDTLFVNNYSYNPEMPSKKTRAQLPVSIQNMQLDSGAVFGPMLEGPTFSLYKVTNVVEDTVYSVKASHILVNWDSETDEDKAKAKNKARAIMDSIRRGTDFAELAIRNSKDPGSGMRGGDLGWFGEGQMVPPFNDAVFAKEGTGLVNEIVESNYGYHIINVTEPKTNITYVISKIQRGVYAGEETKDIIFGQVSDFLVGLKSAEEFIAKADSSQVVRKYSSGNVSAMDQRLTGLNNGRQVVQWAFREGEENKISEIISLDEAYVVAAITNVTPKGTANLESVREEVSIKVRNEKKAEAIIKNLDLTKSLDEMASAYGNGVTVRTANALNIQSSAIEGIGIEPVGVGAAFALQNGEKSKTIEGENGILVVEMVARTEATAKEDYSQEKAEILQGISTRSGGAAFQALKELIEIEDNRYRFY